jgi:hypothetical protein
MLRASLMWGILIIGAAMTTSSCRSESGLSGGINHLVRASGGSGEGERSLSWPSQFGSASGGAAWTASDAGALVDAGDSDSSPTPSNNGNGERLTVTGTGDVDASTGMAELLPSQFSTLSICEDAADGFLCKDGDSIACAGGAVIAVSRCLTSQCANATTCVAPGSGSAVGVDAVNQGNGTRTPECTVFDESECGYCLGRHCCDEGKTCADDPTCAALWSCMSACDTPACISACAEHRTSATPLAQAIVTCSRSYCSGSCGDTEPCALFPGSYGNACAHNLGLTKHLERNYLCSEGQTLGFTECQEGCHAAPLGSPDYCLDADPCSNSPYNGNFCGETLSPLADEDVLYTCYQQATLESVRCSHGCRASAPGYPDVCK